MKQKTSKEIKIKLPKKKRFHRFFLRRLLICTLAAVTGGTTLLMFYYKKEAREFYSDVSSDFDNEISNYTRLSAEGVPVMDNELQKYGAQHLANKLASAYLRPEYSDRGVILIHPSEKEYFVSGSSLYFLTSQHDDSDQAQKRCYFAAPETAEKVSSEDWQHYRSVYFRDQVISLLDENLLFSLLKHSDGFYNMISNLSKDSCSIPLWIETEGDSARAFAYCWYYNLWARDKVPITQIFTYQNGQTENGRIIENRRYVLRDGVYVEDRSSYDSDPDAYMKQEDLWAMYIAGFPADCESRQLTAQIAKKIEDSGIYGMLAAEIDQYQQIIADSSGEKREQYYRDKMNEQSLNNAETAVKKEDIPTPEEQLRDYYQRMGRMPYNVLSNIDTPFRESERTPFYTNGTKELTLHDDTWYIFYCAHRDFWHEEMPRLTLIGIQFLLGAVLLALIWSLIAYFRFRHRYEMEEYRRNLTASLAHDLKSPLMAISSYSENLLNDVQPEKKHHYSKSILENTQYMDNIIVNVLELSRLEKNGKTKRKAIDLTALTSEILSGMQEQLDARSLKASVSGSCTVKADRAMMMQAIRNLLDNALKYTPEGGSITVTGEKHTLSIVNDIAEEQVNDPQQLCEAFVKGDEARSNRMGTGLGLSIVQQIAVQNKLRLHIDSSMHQFRVGLSQRAPISLKRIHKAK
ncbi:MAG: HAMP domain-containing histidine kinase [Oscillospiraceae bacterium]|nr:HAMP domain-containing histidine kinase [Oscillospiraceae bacterium]